MDNTKDTTQNPQDLYEIFNRRLYRLTPEDYLKASSDLPSENIVSGTIVANFDYIPNNTPAGKVYISTAQVVAIVGTTSLYTATIPGGLLGSNNAIRFHIVVSDIDATVTGVTINIKYGGTTIATTGVMTSGSTNGAGVIEGYILGDGASNAQKGNVIFLGRIGSSVPSSYPGSGTSSINSTVDQNLVIEAVCGSAGDDITVESLIVERIS